MSSADLLVTQQPTPTMNVDVAAGSAFVRNDLATHGGTYHVYNDATATVAVAASDPTNPRDDLVVAVVRDSQYFGGTDAWALEVLTGTAAATPADPAIPTDGSYLRLARVRVAAGATSITDANITDLRPRAAVPANVATPVGAVLPYAGAAAPAGWLLCDGGAVSRTTYAALFGVVGTTFGAGDGASTFNLPDLRGRSALGAGAGPGLTSRTLAAKGGAETHVLATAEMPAHGHTQNSHDHNQDSHAHGLSHAHSLNGASHSHAVDGDYGARIAVTVVDGGHVISPDTGQAGQQVSFSDIDHENVLAPGEAGGSALSVATQSGNSQGTTANNQAATATNQNTGGGGAHNNVHPFLALNHIIRAF